MLAVGTTRAEGTASLRWSIVELSCGDEPARVRAIRVRETRPGCERVSYQRGIAGLAGACPGTGQSLDFANYLDPLREWETAAACARVQCRTDLIELWA